MPSGALSALVALLLVVACAWQTHTQTQVWTSDLALWTHAQRLAPHKPRPTVNVGLALLNQGQTQGGTEHLVWALELAGGGHVPPWDARQTNVTVRRALTRLVTQARATR